MSAYGHGKPLRVSPKDRGIWRYGEGALVGKCDFCICTNCTGKNCWMKSKTRHCEFCWSADAEPVIVCDGWDRKPHKVFKVKKRYGRQDYIVDTLAALQKSVVAITEHLGLTESEDINDDGKSD